MNTSYIIVLFFQPARHTKLEKADILEMAVKHLQNVQRQQLALAMATDSSVLRKFKTGFNECATEIDRYMNQIDGVDSAMKQRVASHLHKCISGMEQVAQLNFPGFTSMPFLSGGTSFTSSTNQTQLETSKNVGDQNNNPRIQIPQGIQLIPSRLPSGELALLLPNSNNLPYFPSTVTATIQNRPSAFAAVVPQSTSTQSTMAKIMSPSVSPTNVEIVRPRNPSPHGFRPVVPVKQKTLNEDHQVPQISSTSLPAEKQFSQPLEVKTLKFPINKKVESPKKLPDALCVITNQNERYKQAQMKGDSASYPENVVVQGLKRKFNETHGLLTFASNDTSYAPAPKIMRTQYMNPSSSFMRDIDERKPEESSLHQKEDSSKKEQSSNNMESNSDMWRPW